MLNIVSRTKASKKPNAKAQTLSEIMILAVVWLLLIGAFLLADYAHSPKLQRYQLELTSYTEGIAKPQLLSKYCGDNVITNLYDNRNDPNYGMTQACAQASQPTQLMSEAKQYFAKTQQALAAALTRSAVRASNPLKFTNTIISKSKIAVLDNTPKI